MRVQGQEIDDYLLDGQVESLSADLVNDRLENELGGCHLARVNKDQELLRLCLNGREEVRDWRIEGSIPHSRESFWGVWDGG